MELSEFCTRVKDAVSLQKQRNRAVSRAIPLADAEIVIKQSIEAIAIDTGDITVRTATCGVPFSLLFSAQ